MRIKSICLTWFRGAAEPVCLEPRGKSILVYGENGSGKSSFVDAAEYVIHGGKIRHLSHEYSGRNQENAVPNTQTPPAHQTQFWITFENDATIHIRVDRNGTHSISDDGAIHMEHWDYRKTILRQDEVAEFIHFRKGEKYSALLPLLGLHDLEIGAENVRQLTKAVDHQSQLRENEGRLTQGHLKRRQAFGDDSDEMIEARLSETHATFCPGRVESKDPLSRCEEIGKAISERLSEYSLDHARYVALRSMADVNIDNIVNIISAENAVLARTSEPLILEKLEVLQASRDFAMKLEYEAEVACPACGRAIPVKEFNEHVSAEQQRLDDLYQCFQRRKTAIDVLARDVMSIRENIESASVSAWREEIRNGPIGKSLAWIEQSDSEQVRRSIEIDGANFIHDTVLAVVEKARQSSQSAPADVAALSEAKSFVELAKDVFSSREIYTTVSRTREILRFLDALEAGVRVEIRERSNAIIGELSNDISRMWGVLHPGEPIDNVRLYVHPEDDKSIDIALRFHGKEQDSPRLTLSEGYRNSLGLCIFLAMANRASSLDRPLILDDVVVSLDRNHRGMLVKLLADDFRDRQVIVFTHDRDWFTDLRYQLDERHWNFGSLLPYKNPTVGIRWSDRTTSFDDARAHVSERPDAAANDARKIMDIELSRVAWRLRLRMPYLPSEKNDKRMSHEFLERIIADGKSCFKRIDDKLASEYVAAIDSLKEADRLLLSWGNRGSHSFDVVPSEAVELIDSCEQALEVFKCSSCSKHMWFADAERSEWLQCECGRLRWVYKKG